VIYPVGVCSNPHVNSKVAQPIITLYNSKPRPKGFRSPKGTQRAMNAAIVTERYSFD